MQIRRLNPLEDAFGLDDDAYRNAGFQKLTHDAIDRFEITPGYRAFARTMAEERTRRPAALRDVLDLPADVTFLTRAAEFRKQMEKDRQPGGDARTTARKDRTSALRDGRTERPAGRRRPAGRFSYQLAITHCFYSHLS